MKICFVTTAYCRNYLEDCIFHGLVTLGHDVYDSKHMFWMSEMTPEQKAKQYGKGFTLCGTLPDRTSVNRAHLSERILSKEFDAIIYGNGTIRGGLPFLDEVLRSYSRGRIAFCDGGDETTLDVDLLGKGVCFKRELVDDARFIPISYAIPKEKLIISIPAKEKLLATVIPGDPSTYVFDDEAQYYADYASSYFGKTKKKGGWDCLRHYEILANRCVTYFEGFEAKPKLTMWNWPAELQTQANKMFESKRLDGYEALNSELFAYCSENLTTQKLADYVLSHLDI